MVSTRFTSAPSPASPLKALLIGALALAGVGALFDLGGVQRWVSISAKNSPQDCEAIVRSDARLSREQLASLLTVPERDSKQAIRKIVAEPYCRLPRLQVRSGVVAEREAYPLAFDPNTQLVILYENDEYAGYRFRFQ